MTTRQAIIDKIRQNPAVSVLIVGAGINGIGTFRDLALQGVDVLLIDRGDFCSGTSAASSHMVHGGLRYLENGEFRLVREALRERNRLLKNAPHYVKPLPTTIPIFGWMSGILNAPLKFLGIRDKPGKRGAIVVKIGLTVYDWFTRRQQTLPRHHLHLRKKSLEKRPSLNPEIIGTATYYDAWMPTPERICMELVMDGEAASENAHALNYMPLVGISEQGVELQDKLTGETLHIQPQLVVNAAGPWIDFANQALQKPTKFIGGTKGSHLVLDHPELRTATQQSEMFFENEDGRICLFFPLEDKVLVGSTDIPINNPDEARCTDEEIDYFLEMIDVVFPKIEVNRSNIVYRFSGVRPLPYSDAATPGQISRDHSIKTLEPNGDLKFPVFSLIGGKWTTFRAFSEQAADVVLERLGKTRQIRTTDIAIGGGKDYPQLDTDQQKWIADCQAKTRLSTERIETLFNRYGTRASLIAEFIGAGDDKPLENKSDFSQREILFLTTHEKVVHVDDMLKRRTLLAMLGHVTRGLIEEVANLMASELNWSAAQVDSEVQRAVEIFENQHGLTF